MDAKVLEAVSENCSQFLCGAKQAAIRPGKGGGSLKDLGARTVRVVVAAGSASSTCCRCFCRLSSLICSQRALEAYFRNWRSQPALEPRWHGRMTLKLTTSF